MKHKYQSISGWFNFQDIYSEQVVNAPKHGAIFVEVGTFLGKSASFMGVEIFNSGKNIQFFTIDTFEGTPTERDGKHAVAKQGNYYNKALQNLMDLPHVKVLMGSSKEWASTYMPESIDFVFIDASHEFEDVVEDIQCWLPLVKKGGYIGGHDYTDHTGVRKAVDQELPHAWQASATSWLYQKPPF